VTSAIQRCDNCGAPADESADGRSLACRHCGATERRAIDPAKLAMALRRDVESIAEQLVHLADVLATIVPDRLAIERAGGLFSRKHVSSVTVSFDDEMFHAAHDGSRLVSVRRDLVRGIALRTHALALDQWLAELAAALSRHAATSAVTRDALSRLFSLA